MVIIPIASLPIEFIRKQLVQSAPATTTSDEITLPTSLRASGGYAVFLYAWEWEFESVIDLVTALDSVTVALVKTDPGTTMPHLNDSQVIGMMGLTLPTTALGSQFKTIDKQTFIRPIILAGDKIFVVCSAIGLAVAVTVNIRLHYQLKWVNAQVFNRSLLTNV